MGTPGSCKGFCPLLSCEAGRCGQWVNGDPQIALDGPGAGRARPRGLSLPCGVEIVRGLTHSQGATEGVGTRRRHRALHSQRGGRVHRVVLRDQGHECTVDARNVCRSGHGPPA